MNKTLATLVVCLALLMAIPAMADVTVGLPPDPGAGNCFPWGCAYNAHYQQVYGQGAFSGAITITNLEFYNTQFNSGSTFLGGTGNWAITLSTTFANVNTLSGSFAGNLANGPGDSVAVWSGDISQPWSFGDTLHINLTHPFTYNPAVGNLLMTVVGSNVSLANGAVYFDTNSTGGIMSRVYCSGGIDCGDNGTVAVGYGLVTTFSTGNSLTPEPGTLVMLGTGVLGLASILRRKMNL
jgi:hypothetical protein